MSDGKSDSYRGKLYSNGTLQSTLDFYGDIFAEYEDRHKEE